MNISFIVADSAMSIEQFCTRYNVCKFDVLINNPAAVDVLTTKVEGVEEGTVYLVPPSSLTNNFHLACDSVVYPHDDVVAERAILDAIRTHVGALSKSAGYATISKAQRYLLDPKARSSINIRTNTVLLRKETSADELLRSGCFDFKSFRNVEGYCMVGAGGRKDKFVVYEMVSGPPAQGRGSTPMLYVRGRQAAPNSGNRRYHAMRSVVLPARKVMIPAQTELPARKFQPDVLTDISHVSSTRPVGSLQEVKGDLHDWLLHLCGQEVSSVSMDADGRVYLASVIAEPNDMADSIGHLTTFDDKWLFTLNSDLASITMFSGACVHNTALSLLDDLDLLNDIDDIPMPPSPKRAKTAATWPPSESPPAVCVV